MALAQSQRTHCPRDHPYDEANTYRTSDGRRHCAACQSLRYHDRKPRPTTVERFWRLIERQEGGCWIYRGAVGNTGYGVFSLGHRGGRILAHRYPFELLVEPIPDGLVIDHLCCVKLCVNPAHLDPTTIAENVRRGGKARRNA